MGTPFGIWLFFSPVPIPLFLLSISVGISESALVDRYPNFTAIEDQKRLDELFKRPCRDLHETQGNMAKVIGIMKSQILKPTTPSPEIGRPDPIEEGPGEGEDATVQPTTLQVTEPPRENEEEKEERRQLEEYFCKLENVLLNCCKLGYFRCDATTVKSHAVCKPAKNMAKTWNAPGFLPFFLPFLVKLIINK